MPIRRYKSASLLPIQYFEELDRVMSHFIRLSRSHHITNTDLIPTATQIIDNIGPSLLGLCEHACCYRSIGLGKLHHFHGQVSGLSTGFIGLAVLFRLNSYASPLSVPKCLEHRKETTPDGALPSRQLYFSCGLSGSLVMTMENW